MTVDLQAIASGLSEAQREALLRHGRTQTWGGRNDLHVPLWSGVGRFLKDWGLIQFISTVSSMTELTPLGLALRAYLQQQQGEGE